MSDSAGFTDRFVASLKVAAGAVQTDFFETEARYRGLAIRVSKTGLKTWCFFFSLDGKRIRMALGSYPGVSVKEAHRRAVEARGYLSNKPALDPRGEMALKKAAGMTVADLVEAYIENVRTRRVKRKGDGQFEDGLRSAKKLARAFRTKVTPVIGTVTLGELHTRDVNRVLDCIDKPIAKARTFTRMRAMLHWAVSRGDLDRSPTDQMERPEDSVPRDRTLSQEEIRVFWNGLDRAFEHRSVRRILQLCLVLGQRVGEVAGMARAELDLERKHLWVIPPARSKNKCAHELPLPPLAVEIIRDAIADAGASAFVFPNPRAGAAYTSSTITSMVCGAWRKIGIAHFSSHDLRRTCADSMADLGVLDSIVGRVLNHRSVFKSTITQRHYITRSYEREMRGALELWESRLRGIISGPNLAEITPLRAA